MCHPGSMIAGDVVEVLLDADKQPSLALSWPSTSPAVTVLLGSSACDADGAALTAALRELTKLCDPYFQYFVFCYAVFTANYTKAKESAIDLALHAASYSHVFPMHDVPGKGASKKQMLAFAKDLQKNRPRLGKGKGTYA